MVRIIDPTDRFFPFMPKGWFVIILTVFTLLSFLVYSLPLAGTDTYTAMMPYIFVVTFLYMLTLSPRDSWVNFKTAYFYVLPKIRDKVMAVSLSIAGAIGGFFVGQGLTSTGLIILAFPSGATLIPMGTLFIISYFFIVAFYEESFTIWFAGTIANNLRDRIGNEDTLWFLSLMAGTGIWTLIHIVAVIGSGAEIFSMFIFIFSLGLLFRIVGYVAGKLQGKLYSSYFPLFFHWFYDVYLGLWMAAIIL